MATTTATLKQGQAVSRGVNIPTKIIDEDLLSGITEANTCFVHQRFSEKLQAYMINYVITVSSLQSVYL